MKSASPCTISGKDVENVRKYTRIISARHLVIPKFTDKLGADYLTKNTALFELNYLNTDNVENYQIEKN